MNSIVLLDLQCPGNLSRRKSFIYLCYPYQFFYANDQFYCLNLRPLGKFAVAGHNNIQHYPYFVVKHWYHSQKDIVSILVSSSSAKFTWLVPVSSDGIAV